MNFPELMAALAAKVGLPEFPAAAEGGLRIDVDGMELSFVERPETDDVLVMAEVGQTPPEGRELLYQTLLAAMEPEGGLDGLVFSCDVERNVVRLHRRLPLRLLDAESFVAAVEAFVNQLEEWRRLLKDFRPVGQALDAARQAESEERQAFGADGFMQV